MECSPVWPNEIDLFVLSHFDDDHVNGVERFLQTRSVRYLALPYMDPAQRLVQAISGGEDTCSASTASLQLDPVSWLSSRGLSERVESIVFIRGSSGGDDDATLIGEPRLPVDQPPSEQSFDFEFGTRTDARFQSEYSGEISRSQASRMRLRIWHHASPLPVTYLPIEFMFYNSKRPDLFRKTAGGSRIARRSGATIEKLQAEIDAVMQLYGLKNPSRPPKRGWRSALRKVYERHFGQSAKTRNNISLCLLVRPLVSMSAFPDRRDYVSEHSIDKSGSLCLGDIEVDADSISAMREHFGSVRWSSLCLVQVPHHGSRHSWETGSAAAFAADWFVHCVPDESAHHPHTDVENDLRGFNVLRADYKNRVTFDYRLRCRKHPFNLQ